MPPVTYRQLAAELAESQVGVTEVHKNNWGPKVSEYLKSTGITFPAAWCMAFVHWCFEKVGLDLRHVNLASVGFFTTWAAQMGWVVAKPVRWDVVAFQFTSDNWPDHVGFVRRNPPGPWILTTEGNTGTQGSVSDSSGGRDGVRHRIRREERCIFIRVEGRPPKPSQQQLNKRKAELRIKIIRMRDNGIGWRQIKSTAVYREWRSLGGK
jgi:hypothetical protein